MGRAVDEFGGLDVMVHNAFSGTTRPYRIEDATDEEWTRVSRSAVWASIWCAQAASPHLAASGRGRLILVSSAAGIEGSANLPLYGAVKGAQRALAKSLAREWGDRGVTVNCIAPVALTGALEHAFAANPELQTAPRGAHGARPRRRPRARRRLGRRLPRLRGGRLRDRSDDCLRRRQLHRPVT